MKVLERIQINLKPVKKDATFGVLIFSSPFSKNSYNGKLLGLTLSEWVGMACQDMDTRLVEYNGKDNVLQVASSYVNKSLDYTIILLSRTPLITGNTINQIKEFCIYKDINICKLPVGYVIKNSSLNDIANTQIDSVYSQNIDDFYIVENKKQMDYALGVLHDRINSFHISNGVEIIKPSSTYIEPQVDIAKGTIIYAGNILKGNTFISENVILKENNVIDNSVIGKDCCISGSVITNCKITSGVFISAFCELIDCRIEENSIIGGGSHITNTKIKSREKIPANSVIGENNDSDSRTW